MIRDGILFHLISRTLHKIAYLAPGGSTFRPALHRLRGANIGKNVWISQFVYVDELHPENITIKDNCTIGMRTSIISHFYWGSRRRTSSPRIVIEKDVYIGPHCVILPNVRIGEGAVIKAGTVVSRNVPARAFYGNRTGEVLGTATVPLTSTHSYEEFTQGLRVRVPGR